jgi:uncharacterized protein (TIGR01568 family)
MFADISGNSTSTSSSSSMTDETSKRAVGVGIVTFSTDPDEDFRSSMKRMVEAHHIDASQPLDWDFIEELLVCYLKLNDKSMHKHVLTAFSDITTGFRRSRRTVLMSTSRQNAIEREEMSDSPGQYYPADFPEDCHNERTE